MKAIDILLIKNPKVINGYEVEEIINRHCPGRFFKDTIDLCEKEHSPCPQCWDQEVSINDYINDDE